MSDAGGETPWAAVQRLRGGGASFEQVVLALQEKGLAREDIELLLQDDVGFRDWSRGRAPPAQAPAPAPAPTATVPVDSGRVVRWAVITLSALACGLALTAGRGPLALLVAAVTALPAVGVLIREFRKGLRRTAKPLGAVLFFAFILPTVSGLVRGWDAANLGAALLFLSAVPLMIWAARTGERLQGLADFTTGTVFESGDVQFTVCWPQATLGPGESLELLVCAQNCVEAPRELRISVRGDLRSHLAPFEHRVTIDPGCIVEAKVPVRAPPLAPARLGFTIDLGGSGTTAGRRVRLAQGAEWVTPSESLAGNLLGAASLVTVGLGVFTLGSNETITVKVDLEKPYTHEERAFSVRELYRPAPAALEAAAKS